MKFLEIDDPCEVLPISCRLLQLFGLGRGDKIKWFFWIQCAFYVPFNIITRFMADFDTTIALFRNGSEILFVALMFSQIIALYLRRRSIYETIDMLQSIASKHYSDDVFAFFIRRNVVMNKFSVGYCKFFIVLSWIFVMLPPMTTGVMYIRQSFNQTTQHDEFIIPSEMNFYNLDIRHNLLHYSIYIIAIGVLSFTGSLSLCTKDVVDFGTIRTTALMFEMLAMHIRELPRQITQQHLKTIIERHQTVLQCFRKLQQSLSLALLIQLTFFSAVWCFILVYILLMGLSSEVLNLCIFLIVITVETYYYCALCTELTTKGNEILLALQELPWYEQPVKIQKQILLMIRQSQVPTVLSAGKLVSVNIALFSSMIQKTYSLYLVMKDIF